MIRSLLLGLCPLFALAGCGTMENNGDIAARITNPTPASRAALQSAINDALQTEALLADDALTNSSLLIIERKTPQSLQNVPATGRNLDSAIQFRLVMNDEECILIDTRDGGRRKLASTTCRAD